MSRVNNSVVFIIGPDLPSVPLLLLTHPGFALPKLISSLWCSLPPDVSQRIFLSAISFGSFLNINLVFLMQNFMSKLLLCLFYNFFLSFFLKIGLMSKLLCGGGGRAKTSNQSQILDCIQGERVHHSHSRCDEVCEELSRDKSAGKC